MSLIFKLVDNPDFVLCEVHGDHENPQDSIDYFLEILLHCRSTGASRVLIDIREIRAVASAVEKIVFYEKIIDKYEIYLKFGGLPIKMAFLINANKFSEYNPGLDVAKRRNFPSIVTTDLQEAMAWLGENSDEIEAANTRAIFEY